MSYNTDDELAQATLWSVFDEQALARPLATAVIDASGQHSYGEVRTAALALAQCVYDKGTRPGELVAILCEKSVLQVSSVLGIVRSGAA